MGCLGSQDITDSLFEPEILLVFPKLCSRLLYAWEIIMARCANICSGLQTANIESLTSKWTLLFENWVGREKNDNFRIYLVAGQYLCYNVSGTSDVCS